MRYKRILPLIVAIIFCSVQSQSQVTTSGMSGFVKGENGESLAGATVTAKHEPTGTVYTVVTKKAGEYNIANMNPGGPYTIMVTYVNYSSDKHEDVNLTLGENSRQDFQLSSKAKVLTGVTVETNRASQGKGGTETTITRDRIENIPSVGRNITDYLRSVPQAKLVSGSPPAEGAISIAGQNNRFNAFYIDGALNNDVFGLSATGTNGGQAQISPISIDAIDQIQVVISPYDASLSGFTGGGINAITRSGTNKTTGSVYFLYSDQNLYGKTPTGDKSNAIKLPDFKKQTYGFRIGGPIIKNKIFYFVNYEQQRDRSPQVFDTSKYVGTNRPGYIATLVDTFKTRFGYDPGGYIDNPATTSANKFTAKIDYKINDKNKFAITYRYSQGQKYVANASTPLFINFYNDGFSFPTTTNSISAELRSQFSHGASNRLLVTYTNVDDRRGYAGAPFPRVTIFDGPTADIVIGPDVSSVINLLKQKNSNLLDVFKFNVGRHNISVGTDDELNDVYNAFIQNAFGAYTYNSLSDFLTDAKPRTYTIGYSLLDAKTDINTKAAAAFKVLRLGAFINDEFRPNDRLTFNFGVRFDKSSFVTTPGVDTFTNNIAIPIYSQYYDLKGAKSGQKPNIPVSVSPRIGFSYRIPQEGVTIRGGAGVFTGRMPLVWPGGMYNNNGYAIGGFSATGTNPALNTIRFRPDPYGQWRAADVGITLNKGPLNLVSKNLQVPKVFRTSMAFDKQLGKGWSTTMEAFFTKNMVEVYYTNIGILPPTGTSIGPGSRNVYPSPDQIPVLPTPASITPYADFPILLSNLKTNTGFSYNYSLTIDKRFQKGLAFTLTYNYGDAEVVHEPTSSVNLSQWRFSQTVNGRNFIDRSKSDFSAGHRIFAYLSKKFTYLNRQLATTVSLVYTGQSGNPISYVYGGNAVRDDLGSSGNDLLYIPTASELQSQIFLTNTVGTGAAAVTYTPQQQRDALEAFIQNSKYLSKHRGEFAARNGDRLPFTNIVDLKIAQDFNIRISSTQRLQFQVTYDMFNFTNFLNRDWGRTYYMSFNNYPLISFAGYVAPTNLTPQYRFNPQLTQAQSSTFVSPYTSPSFSPRWSSLIGLRMNF